MAIIKHRVSKNSRAAKVVEYYTQVHRENQKTGHYEPVLDEYGLRQERKHCRTMYIDPQGRESSVDQWITDVNGTNRKYGKNKNYEDVKFHEFIISFPAEDREKLTDTQLEQIGRSFAKRYCEGHSTLISIHRDTENDHIHITINSVRGIERREQIWMVYSLVTGESLPCETKAGGKYQDSNALRRDRNQWILEVCKEHGLKPEDNDKVADERKKARYSEKNQYLRTACLECGAAAHSVQEFKSLLSARYGVVFSVRGKTISVRHPDVSKPVRLDTLGLEPAEVFSKLSPEELTVWQGEWEEKKYIQWIRERRERNERKAERVIERSQRLLEDSLRAKGKRYCPESYQDLDYLIRQCSQVEAVCQTEIEKMNRLIERWSLYYDTQIPDTERRKHEGYVRWCGCIPDSTYEYRRLCASREAAEMELCRAMELRKLLLQTAEEWENRSEIDKAKNKLHWAKLNEKKLKQQIKVSRENRKRLLEIMMNCERAAQRRLGCDITTVVGIYQKYGAWPEGWENYGKFYLKFMSATEREQKLLQDLRHTKEQQVRQKENLKLAKKLERDKE